MERTISPYKPSEEMAAMQLPNGTLTEQGRAVLLAVASGEVAPTQGATLIASLGSLAKLAEADELEARIKALEERATKEASK